MADLAALKAQFTLQAQPPVAVEPQLGSVRFSPCGKLLAGAGYDGRVHRWDVSGPEWKPLPPLAGGQGWAVEVAFDPAGQFLFCADSWGGLRCWKTAFDAAEPVWTQAQAHDGWIHGLAVSPDGQTVATCGRDRTVRLWSAADGAKRIEATGFASAVFRIAFHPQQPHLVAGEFHGAVRQIDAATGQLGRELNATALFATNRLQEVGGVRALAFSPDGTRLACGGTKPSVGGNVQGIPTVLMFDWHSGQQHAAWELGGNGDVYVFDLLWPAPEAVLAVVSGNPGQGKLTVRAAEDGSAVWEDTQVPNPHSLSRHPGGELLAIAATNAGSNGNGRQLDKAGLYPGNSSPIHVYRFPKATA